MLRHYISTAASCEGPTCCRVSVPLVELRQSMHSYLHLVKAVSPSILQNLSLYGERMVPKAIRAFCFLYVIAWIATHAANAQSADIPDVATIVRNAEATQARSQRETLSWTTVFELPVNDAFLHFANAESVNERKINISLSQKNNSQQIAAITIRDGVWYVVQERNCAKHRPYEALLGMPSLYLYLSRSQRLLTDKRTLAANRFESLNGNVARFRILLPDSIRRQLESSVAMFDKAKQLNPERSIPSLEARVSQVRDAFQNGIPCEVEVDTGIIIANGPPGNQMRVKDIRWSPTEQSTPLPKQLETAVDRTESLLDRADSLDDLILMNHAGAWRPGSPASDSEAVLLNIRNGDLRRIPYPLAGTSTGCFSKDRRSVFITGMVDDEGGFGLFQIDLTTGTVRRLGENGLGRWAGFPTLSPDGETLAVISKTFEESEGLASQVSLVKLASGEVTKIGEPLDTAFISWLPDRAGFILVTRKSRKSDIPAETTIARMDFSGHVTPIRRGTFPILLGSEQKIVFCDEDDKKWKICDLAGQNASIVGDGLVDYGFPALAPDAKQLIMMRFARSTGPRPYIVEIVTGKTKPVPAGEGLWALPAWR